MNRPVFEKKAKPKGFSLWVVHEAPIRIGDILYRNGRDQEPHPVRVRGIRIYADYDLYEFEWVEEDREDWSTMPMMSNCTLVDLYFTYEEAEQELKRAAEDKTYTGDGANDKRM